MKLSCLDLYAVYKKVVSLCNEQLVVLLSDHSLGIDVKEKLSN